MGCLCIKTRRDVKPLGQDGTGKPRSPSDAADRQPSTCGREIAARELIALAQLRLTQRGGYLPRQVRLTATLLAVSALALGKSLRAPSSASPSSTATRAATQRSIASAVDKPHVRTAMPGRYACMPAAVLAISRELLCLA